MEGNDLIEHFDNDRATMPATKLELYMVTRLLQNYTLLRVRELADVSLNQGEQRSDIAERLGLLETEIDRTLATLISGENVDS